MGCQCSNEGLVAQRSEADGGGSGGVDIINRGSDTVGTRRH